MSSNPSSLGSQFLPEEPMHPDGSAFFAHLSEMLDGQPKEPAAVEAALSGHEDLLEKIAADLYRIASMLLGEGEESIALLEQVVAALDIPACETPLAARHSARLILAGQAIDALRQRDAAQLAAPSEDASDSPVSCIEDDDLDAAGITPPEFERMISGPDNHRLRDWLESLTASIRIVFVLRAVAGLSSAEVAGLLAEHGGPAAEDWTPDQIRTIFRQGLCSLASQIIHATVSR